jgi:hypothetical protein
VGIALWIHLLGSPDRLQRFAVSWAVGVAWFGPSTLWMWGLTQPGYVLGVLLAWGPMVGAVGIVSPGDRRRLVAVPAPSCCSSGSTPTRRSAGCPCRCSR